MGKIDYVFLVVWLLGFQYPVIHIVLGGTFIIATAILLSILTFNEVKLLINKKKS